MSSSRPFNFRYFIWLSVVWLISPLLFAQPVDEQVAQTPVEFVELWLEAWQRQDLDDYFSHYREGFQTGAYPDTQSWRAYRTRNISKPPRIELSLENFELLESSPESANVRLWFAYRTESYADRTHKALTLQMDDDAKWLIVEERNLEVQALPSGFIEQISASAPSLEALSVEQALVPEGEPQVESQVVVQAERVLETEVAPLSTSTSLVQAANSPPQTPTSIAETSGNVNAPVRREQWVPPGFEDLTQEQVTEIDVYYGGYYLSSVLAEFNETEVTILDQVSITDGLSNLKNVETFTILLQQAFDAHPELICHSEFQIDCGVLETESVGVIFDRALLRLWLFVAPELLLPASEDTMRFLPASEAGISFMNQSALYFSADELDVEQYNFFNNAMLAWGENRVSMRSNLVSDEGLDIDTLAFLREYQGKDYRLGLMRESANGFSFMSNERFVGASYGSSLLTRSDLEQSLGTQLEFYFSTRSRVEIYQEGRLISTGFYNVGNHFLDTSNLPNGSYTIEIKIIDAAGTERIEERYFSKTARIAPADQPLYFLHVGRLENELDTNRLSSTGQDETMVRGGYSLRLGQSLGGSIGASHVNDSTFWEMGLFKQGQSYELQANTAYEDTGALGTDIRLRYRHEKFSLTLNGRNVSNGLELSQIGQDYSQYNAVLELPVDAGYYSFFHRYVTRPNVDDSRNYGMRFRARSKKMAGGNLSTNVEISKNDNEVLALFSFTFQLQGNNRTTNYTPAISYSSEELSRDNGIYGSYESNWYRGEPAGNEYNYSLRADYDQQSSIEGRFEADTTLGSADVTARYNESNSQMNISGRLSSSFATDGSTGAFGGKRRSESAFLIRVDGEIDPEARFEVLINGSVRGQTLAGETLLIPVAPYQTYEVELRSVGNTLVNLDNRMHRETLYPGNVVNLNWESKVISIAIGRLVNEQGEPIANALIHNVIGLAISDENGFFQAEVEQDTSSIEVQSGGVTCLASFANPGNNNTVLSLGTLVCK